MFFEVCLQDKANVVNMYCKDKIYSHAVSIALAPPILIFTLVQQFPINLSSAAPCQIITWPNL